MDIVIIGGGASGLFASVAVAGAADCRVTLFERQSRVGRKLAATGNGRCNLSNTNAAPSRYHGNGGSFAAAALERLDVGHTLRLFESLGLAIKEESDGKIYPYSDSALSVVDVLRLAADSAGVYTVTDTEITSIKKKDGRFVLAAENVSYYADRVIVACGGSAAATLGGTDSGYKLLRSLGHRLLPQYPSLVQVKTDTEYVRSLKGIRADGCGVTLKSDGRVVSETKGEVQFTEYGLSGPAIFEISREVSTGKGKMTVCLDLFPPAKNVDAIYSMLAKRRGNYPERTAENYLTGMLQNRLGRVVLKYAGISGNTVVGELSDDDLKRTATVIKAFPFQIKGTMGLSNAQVTAGGIDTTEFYPETLESRLCPGLFACGEVLDIDGDCGGYNLQWAWSSGHLAGISAVQNLL